MMTPVEMAWTQEGQPRIVWSDGHDGFYDYWASTLTCTERS